jgi:cytochrome c556
MNSGAVSIAVLFLLGACGGADEGAPEPTKAEQRNGAVAQNAQASIRARQSHYKEIGAAMKGVGDELKKGEPSVDVIQRHAAAIRDYAPQIEGWFPEGSGSAAGLKTEARDEIWSDPEGFRRSAQAFVSRSQKLHDLAQTGDLSEIRAGVGDLGGTCKGCHDKFRAKQ